MGLLFLVSQLSFPVSILYYTNVIFILSGLWFDVDNNTEHLYFCKNLIGGVMISVLTSCVVDRGFGPGRVKPKAIQLHAALRSKNKDELARNKNNVSEWSDMSIRGLLFQWASTIKIQLSVFI